MQNENRNSQFSNDFPEDLNQSVPRPVHTIPHGMGKYNLCGINHVLRNCSAKSTTRIGVLNNIELHTKLDLKFDLIWWSKIWQF